jgi:hypothetical protein
VDLVEILPVINHILRHFGLAARFVSGYIVQLAPDIKSLDGPSGPEKILPIYMLG